jgi:type VI secretion system secreted protein VgrG
MISLFRFPAADRPLRIDAPLLPDALALLELRGHEAVSELYAFELRLAADRYTDVPFEKVLGKPVTLRIAPTDLGERIIHGIVTRLERQQDDEELAYYVATVEPLLKLWTLRTQCRIFQQLSTPDILSLVLNGIDFKLQLSGTYLSRDYTTQYNETDFAFACRLMEEEGLFYFFEHSADGHTLIICDDVASLPAPGLLDTVLFEADRGGVRAIPRVWQWNKWQQLVTTRFTSRDQCFELPQQRFDADAGLAPEAKIGTNTHKLVVRDDEQEAYAYAGEVARRFDGLTPSGGDQAADLQHIFTEKDRAMRLQAEAAAASALQATGTSTSLAMLPGHKFMLAQHGWGNGNYFTLRVEHVATMRMPARASDEGFAFTYENRFTALADGMPYRAPRSTPRPRVLGPQTAMVTGPVGQEIYVDKYGRIKVQFAWDRINAADSGSSCWVRVAQSWAGPRFGAFFWPRIGHEVVVAFEDGDPDRPLVVGSVYNSANMPPLELPDNAQLTGIKSCIFGGDPLSQFNAVIFHDVPGKEYVQVHSETNAMTNTESDHYEYVPDTHYSFHGSF